MTLAYALAARARRWSSLGIDATVEDYEQVAVIANVSADRPHGDVAYERFTRQGPAALLPLPDIAPEAEILARYATTKWPVTFATATRGDGVANSLARLLQAVYRHHDDDCGLSARHCLTVDSFVHAFVEGAR